MEESQKIEELIANGRLEEALASLNSLIEAEPDNAQWRFLKGKALWKTGDKGGAISEYEHASQLDPQSPATHALEMARSIMDFFNPDIFNP